MYTEEKLIEVVKLKTKVVFTRYVENQYSYFQEKCKEIDRKHSVRDVIAMLDSENLERLKKLLTEQEIEKVKRSVEI